jgi:hypothetical protein
MHARNLAKSDTRNDPGFSMIMVTLLTGTVVVNNNGTVLTLTNPPVGVWMPCVGQHIMTSSTATGIIVA